MPNPFTPPQVAETIERPAFHSGTIAFIRYSMLGGISWIVVAIVARSLFHWESPWIPAMTFFAFTLLGFYRSSGSETTSKLLLGTFLIWFPYPLHAGIAACTVSSGMMPIREFPMGHHSNVSWWTLTLLSITLGWIMTMLYLQNSRAKSEATVGIQFALASWIGQVLLLVAGNCI